MKSALKTVIANHPRLFLVLLAFLMYLPFSHKAFNIDSNVTVHVARQMKENVLNPPLGEYGKLLSFWNNCPAMPRTSVFYATWHPPLVPLYLMPFVAIAGDNEWVLNMAMFPFYCGAVLFFFGITGRVLKRWRMETTLLFMLCPAVLVNAQTVMLDVPLMAFSLGAFYCMLRSDRPLWVFLAGVCAAASCLTKFTGGTVAIAGVVYYLYAKQWRNCLWFLLPVVMGNGWWALHTLIVLGKIQLFSAEGSTILLGDVRYRFERVLSLLGATVVLPVFPVALGLWIKGLRRITLILCAGAAVWSAALMAHLDYSAQHALIYALSASAGGLLIYTCTVALVTGASGRIAAALLAQMTMQLVGGLFLGTMAARYLLPMLFIVVFAVPFMVDRTPLPSLPKQRLLRLIIGCTLPVSLLLVWSDYQYVGAERRFARELRACFPSEDLYYAGRLGYLYYMDKAGGIYHRGDGRSIARGGLVIRNAFNDDDFALFSDKGSFELVRSFSYPLVLLRTMGKGSGFYGCDRIPYSIVTRPQRRVFEVYRRR
jgi:4-amino-4-deoxy-L-arabinose transferase-like glycosyltransferase